MAGSARAVNFTVHPFNNNAWCFNSTQKHGNLQDDISFNSVESFRESTGFGSKFTQGLESWESFGTKFRQNDKARCFEGNLTESTRNEDHKIRFVNGFASQIRHNDNSVAENSSSDEGSEQSTISYDFDSISESSNSQCSANSCQRSNPGDCSDHFSEIESLNSNKSSGTVNSKNSFVPQSPSLRMTNTNTTHSVLSNSEINSMAIAEASEQAYPGDAVQDGTGSSPQTKLPLDLNDNFITNCASSVKSEVKSGIIPECVLELEPVEELGLAHGQMLSRFNPKTKNKSVVQDWLNNHQEQHRPTCSETANNEHEPNISNAVELASDLDGNFQCTCQCVEAKRVSQKGSRKRKRKKKRKVEYEVLQPTHDETLPTIKKPNVKKGKRKRQPINQVNRLTTAFSEESTNFRRRLSQQKISRAEAKQMIRELQKTLVRVNAEIEELKKLTKYPKGGRKKKTVKKKKLKSNKFRRATSLNTLASPGAVKLSGARLKRLKKLRARHDARQQSTPKSSFTFQQVFAGSLPSLTVRDGELEPTYSMVLARGTVPPKKHPLWTWQIGKRPLQGTANRGRKNT